MTPFVSPQLCEKPPLPFPKPAFQLVKPIEPQQKSQSRIKDAEMHRTSGEGWSNSGDNGTPQGHASNSKAAGQTRAALSPEGITALLLPAPARSDAAQPHPHSPAWPLGTTGSCKG